MIPTHDGLRSAEAAYVAATPRSRALHERAVAAMPGGSTRTTTYFAPHPLAIERGQGCRVWDVDGTERLDFIGNYTAMILGHAHPAVVEAVQAQAAKGTAFAATNRLELELAEELKRRVPSLELVRFCNSGTEATMFALRLARAFTGRPKVARLEGGYHGTHDYAEVSHHPPADLWGPAEEPAAVPDSPGTPSAVVADSVVLPMNDGPAGERILRRYGGEVAAVIVEPIMGAGAIPAEPGFLRTLREVTREIGALLVFDEVISLRVATGGAQERYGVFPDLTTMGKVIGGGLPVAAFGGRADVMQLLDPRREGFMAQGGTYNGNPLGMAAGLAALAQLTPEAYERLDSLGEDLRGRLAASFEARDVPVQVTGDASLFCVHFSDRPVTDYRGLAARSQPRNREFFLRMLNQGVMLAPRGLGALSTAVGDAELERFFEAADRVAEEMAATATG
ncbi:MAG: aspartate aminotransferase family protein [Candidatus Dormibacteraeota bacterium]|nr:aspartate aminotransferase family protein [Candidatus Dormibacteraeota bacterium]